MRKYISFFLFFLLFLPKYNFAAVPIEPSRNYQTRLQSIKKQAIDFLAVPKTARQKEKKPMDTFSIIALSSSLFFLLSVALCVSIMVVPLALPILYGLFFIFGYIAGLLAIISGVFGLGRLKNNDNVRRTKWICWLGIALGSILLLASIMLFLYPVWQYFQ